MDIAISGVIGFAVLALAGTPRESEGGPESAPEPKKIEKATFAGGCFWCMQPAFDRLDGVISTRVGYTGGGMEAPTYEQVCSGKTGHAEAIEIVFDPSRIGFSELLEVFWKNIDPAQANGQFADHGTQYRTAVFYHTEEQKRVAEASKAKLEKSGPFAGTIATEVVPAAPFFAAEDYHQDFYKKSSLRYTLYKLGSGRASFLERIWGKKKE